MRGQYIDRDAGSITFKAYAEDWLKAQTFESSTREGVELRLRKHIYPVLGSKTLAQIKPSTVQAWLGGLSIPSAGYRRLVFANVSAILSAAVDDERITKNPCSAKSVRTPKAATHKLVPWTGERAAAVRNALAARDRIVVDLGAGLGLRQGEVFGLSPDDVDFLRGKVEVRRQVKMLRGKLFFGPPKGRKTRTVPLPSSVRDLLAAYLSERPAKPVRLPWGQLDGEPVTVPLILTTRDGRAQNRTTFNPRKWKPALVAAGVEPTPENGCHALRHYYASVLLDAGESIKAVSEFLGHTSAAFTLQTYTHLMPASDERTRKAVDAAFACYMGATSVPEIGAFHAQSDH